MVVVGSFLTFVGLSRDWVLPSASILIVSDFVYYLNCSALRSPVIKCPAVIAVGASFRSSHISRNHSSFHSMPGWSGLPLFLTGCGLSHTPFTLHPHLMLFVAQSPLHVLFLFGGFLNLVDFRMWVAFYHHVPSCPDLPRRRRVWRGEEDQADDWSGKLGQDRQPSAGRQNGWYMSFSLIFPTDYEMLVIHRFFSLTGSAAINLVMVANGEADVYPQVGIRCWDIVAGGLIVREAGDFDNTHTKSNSNPKFWVYCRRMFDGPSWRLWLWLHEQGCAGCVNTSVGQSCYWPRSGIPGNKAGPRGQVQWVTWGGYKKPLARLLNGSLLFHMDCQFIFKKSKLRKLFQHNAER